MTKDQLIEQVTRLKKDNEEWSNLNDARKRSLSMFLGTCREVEYGNDRGKILDWNSIFFELGKLVQEAKVDRDQIELQQSVNYLLSAENDRSKREQKEEESK